MTPAINKAEEAGIEAKLHKLDRNLESGLEAAAFLGVAPQRLFKTLIVRADQRLVVVVLPITKQLNNKRLAAILGAESAALASPAEAEKVTGYRVGAISPLGCRHNLDAFIDESALAFQTIFVSAGRQGLELELAPSALKAACKAQLVAL